MREATQQTTRIVSAPLSSRLHIDLQRVTTALCPA
ncbi:putative leader peptide [Streptacidiphilus jiangxiensis]